MSFTTTDLSEFGYFELVAAKNLLEALVEQGWPDELDGEDVSITFNTYSGCVFLTDENCNVAMLNGKGELDIFRWCVNCGIEGFADEISWDADTELCKKCREKRER